ncbi:MAG: GNAT family N-acetyltransferase [Firmicutes bacterium HGW-Firmicutes-8]|nr:MAG: GNAT family N-acetyltransferase [Firmicutes bacterium HGW-Firmicutes-8]
MSTCTGIFIRSAGDSDIKPATEFAFRMIEEAYGRGSNPAWDYDLLNFEEVYIKNQGNAFLVAFAENDKIVGSLAVRRYDGRIQVLKGFYDLKATAELAKCFVDKRYRRTGIGSLLLKEAEQFCKRSGYKLMYLHTHMYLPGAFEFWQSRGFKARLDEGGPSQTVHMEKNL